MKLMITVDTEVFTFIAGAVLLARRAPKLLQSQLENGPNGEPGLPPEAVTKLVGWASTVKPAAFDDDALAPETEAGGQAYFDQKAAEALMSMLSAGGDPSALLERLKESGRAP